VLQGVCLHASPRALRPALRELGYVEGQTIVFEWRLADTPEQYPALAAELVGLKVDIIVVNTGRIALAAKQATNTVPIVMVGSADAVAQGIVASLARAGGNVTGFTNISPDLSPKALELLTEAIPGIARVAVFWCAVTPNSVGQQEWEQLQGTAQRLGLHLQSLEVRSPDDFEALGAAAVREQADALVTLDCVHINNLAPEQIAGLAVQHRLPGMYHWRRFVEAGGLMSYGRNFADVWRGVAVYVDKLLKGANPATLPVQQPMRFDFVINLKTAAALGLTIPPTLLCQADEVIR
jgi:putative ABC transport system substrate-binding protein